MKFNISSFKVTGTPGASGWVQVHEFNPEDEEKINSRGHLFLVISTARFEEGVEGVLVGRELISRFQEEYYGELSQRPFDALKKAAEKVTNEFLTTFGNVEIASCALVGDVIYSAAGGGGRIVIMRDGMLASIIEAKESVVSASGYPKNGDTLLLGTKSFFENSSPGVIKAALEDKDFDDCSETFGSFVHSKENSGSMGAVVIRFGEEKTTPATSSSVFQDTSAEENKIGLGMRVKSKVASLFSVAKKIIPERRIYIKEELPEVTYSKNKRLTLSVGIMLLVILAISIIFGIRQRGIKNLEAKYMEKLLQANHDLDEAVGLSGVDPEAARELFSQSDEIYQEINNLGAKDSRIDELGKRLEEERGKVLGEYAPPAELFVDLSLLSSGFRVSDFATSGDIIYILDKSNKKIASVEIDSKKSKVLASQENVEGATDIAAYEGRIFTLLEDGVYEIGQNKSKAVEKTWNGEAFVVAYTGNLYILDKEGNSVYRYSGTGESFGEGKSWIASGTKVDFSEAKSFIIDGAVYVLLSGNKILKYSLGAPQNFSVSGEFPKVSHIDAIYSNDECQYLYLLDKAEKRILVVDKKGEYKAQYVSDRLSEATGIVVSENEKKIIILAGDKLLSIEMKHI